MKPILRKSIAAAQVIGGSALVLSCIGDLYRIPATHNLLSVSMYLAFFCYAAAAIYFGVLLWKDRNEAFIPSVLLWATQIPVVVSNPISFAIVTGFGLIVQMVTTTVSTAVTFDFALIERHVLYVAGQTPVSVIGINIFAVCCVQWLWCGRKQVRQQANPSYMDSPPNSRN